ncbi:MULTISPECIES: cytochrome c-type biogenesis protein [Comamonas]|uniref:cytochrome c-type biogenesis protein n=1 Tax=Comamonas TaxID=283 RepID=UPI0001DA6328|nr:MULTISPECIES: cytochrome c-type biogenesis protein [Comamonas]EFI59343.1 cytochrome C-type biogenesis protein [Comamonas thiooxydans]TFF62942.1 cytochrome c-type biogenesis protein CcmH [Comamonas sp. A23]
MKPRSTGAACTVALLACMAMLAQAGQIVQTAQDQELLDREMTLAAQLRCVVCQNQTVAESRAPMAEDMRREIRHQLKQGQSNDQVIAFFEQRYGAFVRYNPPWKPSTWLLWSGPFLAALGGFVLLRRTLRRRLVPDVPLTPEQRDRARQWLDSAAKKESS